MMTPTTFDMRNEIDDEIDELDTELSSEAADELGQVEDAEPGQDWNAEGVFIGACEIIEVPFRKTVKSKAAVRVVFDGEQHLWRSGWHWKSLLKKDNGNPNEVGKELSRAFIGYASKAEAVNDALSDMAGHAGAFDDRIGVDVRKFRDTDWYVVRIDVASICGEPADDEPLPRHATEPRANNFDVLDVDVEDVGIPLPKKFKVVARTYLAFDSQGWWRFGYHYEFKGLASSGPPKLDGEKFPSRKQAQCAALRHAIGFYADRCQDVADKIAQLLASVEESATEIITGRDPETDPETKAAIDELNIAGVSVGEPAATGAGKKPKEPPTEAELQAKAERAFKAKMREATDNLADCVLARIEAEATYKTAKAEEKAAAETLRAIADRGPVRLPIMEYAERNAAAAGQQPAEPTKPTEPVASDAWKLASVTELGLPKGIESKLIDDGIDTIGRLEQRRADVANKREKYPAGIGKAAIDKIENAVLAWLAKNQHADQATEVEPVEAEAVEVPAEAVAATEATSDREIDPEIGDVAARLDELYGNPEFMCERTNGSYGSGREAYERGDLLTDCPLTPGDEQDQWLMGWADANQADGKLRGANQADAADDLGDL